MPSESTPRKNYLKATYENTMDLIGKNILISIDETIDIGRRCFKCSSWDIKCKH